MIIVENPDNNTQLNPEEKLIAYVHYYQYLNVVTNGEVGIITLETLAAKLGARLKQVHYLCECTELNINVAVGNGSAVGDLPMGEYTVEDLNFWEKLN